MYNQAIRQVVVVPGGEVHPHKQPEILQFFDESGEPVAVGGGGIDPLIDIEITDPTKGVILRSPNNTRWRITVDNTGALITTSL